MITESHEPLLTKLAFLRTSTALNTGVCKTIPVQSKSPAGTHWKVLHRCIYRILLMRGVTKKAIFLGFLLFFSVLKIT
jgi:hypothetical protein